MAALLTVEDLTLRFGGVTALNAVSFEVGEDELFAVIGPNGAGKTSIFNCLSGVYRPQKGTITFAGQRAARRSGHPGVLPGCRRGRAQVVP